MIPLLCFSGAAVAFALSALSEVRRRLTTEKLRRLALTKMVASGGGGRVPTGWARDGTPLYRDDIFRDQKGAPITRPKGPPPKGKPESEVVRELRAQVEQLTEDNARLRSRLAERGGHRG